MNIEKIREEFVAWLDSLGVGYDSRFTDFIGGDGEFFDGEVQGLWTCWQASRVAIEIELPEKDPHDLSVSAMFGYQEARKDAVKSIEAAGLKVKV